MGISFRKAFLSSGCLTSSLVQIFQLFALLSAAFPGLKNSKEDRRMAQVEAEELNDE